MSTINPITDSFKIDDKVVLVHCNYEIGCKMFKFYSAAKLKNYIKSK